MAVVMKATEAGKLPQIKFGVYGAPKQGKTTLLGGFAQDPRTAPVLWLNVGGNPNMLLKAGVLDFALNMETFRDFFEPLNFLLTGQNPKHPFYNKWREHFPGGEMPKFKSLVIDTFTDLQGLLIDSVIGIKSDELERYTLDRIEVPEPTKHGKEIAGKTLFAARQMLLALNLHVFLGMQEWDNVIFTGDETTGRILSGTKKAQIGLWGQSRMKVPSWTNLLGRMYWERGGMKIVEVGGRKVQRADLYTVIEFVDDEAHVGNQLSVSLPDRLERPTASGILDLIEAG